MPTAVRPAPRRSRRALVNGGAGWKVSPHWSAQAAPRARKIAMMAFTPSPSLRSGTSLPRRAVLAGSLAGARSRLPSPVAVQHEHRAGGGGVAHQHVHHAAAERAEDARRLLLAGGDAHHGGDAARFGEVDGEHPVLDGTGHRLAGEVVVPRAHVAYRVAGPELLPFGRRQV